MIHNKFRYLLTLVALFAMTAGAWAGTRATGSFDNCTGHNGSIHVHGWAYDPDASATSIFVHAYIWYGESVGSTKEERLPAVGILADIERTDVNTAKGITGNHGFNKYVAVPAGTYTVQIFAIDQNGDGNPPIPGPTSGSNYQTYTVTVSAPFTVSFDANGGSDAPANQNKCTGIDLTLSSDQPVREGYTFVGWNTAQDGSGDSYAPGATYTANADVTLYAQWSNNYIEVNPVAEPAANTKQWTFAMPAFDVEIAPIYAPAAQWAKVENVDQLPTAIEGIFAGTTDAIVKAGTVAMMGDGQTPQGIVMYAVTSTNQATAPELSAFSATVPTAENIADEGADVLVWYYIQGANTPDGQEATAENTFNDSEICATPIKVTVLPNKYDIQFNAANANTIEAGKATVTVGGTAATVTEGKLEGVKMGSEVKMTAKDGYKFRKVEAKKKAVPVSLTYATKEGAVTRIKFNYGGNVYYADFTYGNGSFTRTGGSNGYTFSGSWTMKEENGVLTMTANYNEMNEQFIYFVCTFYADTNEYTQSNTGIWNYSFNGIEVNGTDITSQLTEVK